MKETALITGASSGIGLDLTRLFARDGWDVVLVARSKETLRTIATELTRAHGIVAHVIVADLARPDAAADIVKMLTDSGLTIDALVNNAGLGLTGPFVETDGRRGAEMMQGKSVGVRHPRQALLPLSFGGRH